ncbi:MAG: subtilase-type protease inhibitor [Actinomycetota bacterium]|nr:subtilase-type protease inhibitor [Actinomycetota bacterium]
MSSVGAGLVAAAMMGAPAATATTAAQETFLVLGLQARGIDRFVTLRCDPPSGTHPHSESACRVLSEAGGDFTKIPGQPGTLCPDIYDPVTAIATGDYQGARVNFWRTYPNRCDLARHTAPLFEL